MSHFDLMLAEFFPRLTGTEIQISRTYCLMRHYLALKSGASVKLGEIDTTPGVTVELDLHPRLRSADPGGDTTPALGGPGAVGWALFRTFSFNYLHRPPSSLVIAINSLSTRPPLPSVHCSYDIDIDRILGLIRFLIRLTIKHRPSARLLAGTRPSLEPRRRTAARRFHSPTLLTFFHRSIPGRALSQHS